MNQIRPEDLPAVLEKRQHDEHTQAWILENGSVAIVNSVGGIETLFTPERAYNLLNVLSKYGMTFLHILHPKTMTLNWKKTEGRLVACLQRAADYYQDREDEPNYTWRVLLRSPMAGLAEGIHTPQELLTALAEEPDSVSYPYATLFYDDTWQGNMYEGKLVFAALYLNSSMPTDTPDAIFFRRNTAQEEH
jgi:hypothetical protein